jgi:membrane-bound serine protease (ClpP class)
MTLALIIALFAIGFILIGVELLVTPGFVIGLVGLVFISIGIYVIYQEYGSAAGTTSLVTVSVLLGLFFVVSLRSGFWKRIASKDQITGRASVNIDHNIQIGAEGEALSALRPSGMVLFESGKFEVQSDGSFIDAHQLVVVSKVSSNTIFVKPKTKNI